MAVSLAALALAGCMGEQEQWLQGKWAHGDVHYIRFRGQSYVRVLSSSLEALQTSQAP